MIRCVAVDDEPLALELLEDNIQQVPFLELVKSCRNAFELMKVLEEERIDLIFLDIQMPGLTGIQLLRSLRPEQMVIFVTAYQQFALEGYELNIIDYLLKPVSFERFLQAAMKAKERQESQQTPLQVSIPTLESLFVQADYALIRLPLTDILFIESLKDNLKIYLSSAKDPIITRMPIKTMAEKLPEDRFIRVHQSFIVAIDKIDWVRNMRIQIGTHILPISDSYGKAFFQRIKDA